MDEKDQYFVVVTFYRVTKQDFLGIFLNLMKKICFVNGGMFLDSVQQISLIC